MPLASYQHVVRNEFDLDYLDGKQVFGGENVNVRWPDGTTSTHLLDFFDTGVRKHKHKIVYDLCIVMRYRGMDVRVSVRNSPLMLVRLDQ